MLMHRNPYTFIFFCFIAIIAVYLVVQFRWIGFSGSDWKSIIEGDGKDYYAYLDQIYIKHNFGNASSACEQVNIINGKSVIKCYSGTALLIFPFFFAARAISAIVNIPADGYGEAFQKSTSIAGLFYLLLGLWLLYRLMKQMGLKLVHVFVSLIFIFLATNLLAYSVLYPAMSHVYSFSMICGFLWASNNFIQNKKWGYLVAGAVFLGLVYLIRPVNIIIAGFVFFFFADLKTAISFLKENSKKLLMFILILIVFMCIQNILWFIQCGKFFIWSYLHEGFYFLHPEILNVLFSFRKGLFIYTPLLLVSLAGLFYLFRQNRFRFCVSLIFVFVLIYIISSWWCWTYSDSFGMRPLVDFFAVFAIFFAILFQYIHKWLRIPMIFVCLLCLSLNLVQTYQYFAGIIHPEYMNRQSYKFVFLNTSLDYRNCVGGACDLVPYDKFEKALITEKSVTGDTIIPCINGSGTNEKIFLFDDEIEFSDQIIFKNEQELYKSSSLYSEIRFKKWDFSQNGSSQAYFVVVITYDDRRNTYYYSFPINYLPDSSPEQWQDIQYSVILPKIQSPEFKLSFYIWNIEFQHFLVKDIGVKIFRTA
jgi:hypothetical protein